MKLNLQRPLIFFDLETTGTNITYDRIVEISIIKVNPDGTEEEYTSRINPTIPIPAQATDVHHITNEDVKDEPTFAQVADSLLRLFDNCDIAGFNSNKFDVPLLIEEFSRCGKRFDVRSRKFIDVQTIYHKLEPRTLIAAYRYYCGKDLENAHAANADTRATVEVLKAQLDKYPNDLKNDIEFLSSFSMQKRNLDLMGRIVADENNVPKFNFGKHKDRPVEEVLKTEPGYYDWMMRGDFPQNTKDVLTAIKLSMQKPKR